MEFKLAEVRRVAKRNEYDPAPFIARIEALIAREKLSLRQAGIQSGLDHQAILRIQSGRRPDMMYCILLADFFGINPNELLQLAGWPPLAIFDVRQASAERLPPEAVEVALDIAKIADPGTRKQVAEAVRTLLKKYFTD